MAGSGRGNDQRIAISPDPNRDSLKPEGQEWHDLRHLLVVNIRCICMNHAISRRSRMRVVCRVLSSCFETPTSHCGPSTRFERTVLLSVTQCYSVLLSVTQCYSV
eukprot:751445-Prorocentrum_minimum.AAC.1